MKLETYTATGNDKEWQKNAETTGASLVSLVHQLLEHLTYKQGIADLNSASGLPLPP